MSYEEHKKRSLSLPQFGKKLSYLEADDMDYSRISKSTECLSEPVDPALSCMLIPESMSLEDIFDNHQRLNRKGSKKSVSLKDKLVQRLKGKKDDE